MGRRRSSSHHAIRVLNPDSTLRSYASGKTWCGEEHGLSASLSFMAEGEDVLAFTRRMADCPKCSAAIGKARLAQIADRVRIEPGDNPKSKWGSGNVYRSVSNLFIDGEQVGYIVMDNGWGNPWELREMTADGDRHFGPLVSTVPSNYSKVSPDNVFQPVHTRSRDMLASAALRLRDQGGMRTIAEQEVIREERRVRRAAEDAEREEARRLAGIERERKDGLRSERKELALDWINAVLAQPDLTNSQRAGAQACHDIITGKDVQ